MDISIVIIAFNEERIIGTTVKETIDYLLKSDFKEYEIIIVDDGSTDRTVEICETYTKSEGFIRIIKNEINKGVAGSLKKGFYNCKYEWIYWLPGDNQVPVTELDKLLVYTDSFDIITGNRTDRKDNIIRRFLSRSYSILVNVLYGVGIKDINSTKLMKKEVIDKLTLKSRTNLIDLELLVMAKKEGFKLIETPVDHLSRVEGRGKAVTFLNVVKTLIENITFFYKFYFEM